MINVHKINNNIYITSDEEIKVGDWYLTFTNKEVMGQPRKCEGANWNFSGCKKIILTTDQDLIKDGVQPINDEFLEWFVQNPSCEWVDVKRNYLGSKCLKCGFIENHDEVDTEDCPKCHNTTYEHLYNNKIIIPQEEPKDVVLGYKTSIVGQMLDSDNGFGQVKQVIDENTSDGYHTFKELYEFRKAYNVALFNEWAMQNKYDVHKSWKHNDGEECFGGGWFIVVAVLPSGQISNHYEAKDWDLFKIPEEEKAKHPFDGHTGEDVINRLINI
jgi:predicted nucleic-acid-binding Zn-ribbon protein